MGQAQLVTDLTSDMVIAAFAASVLFIAIYSALAPWYRSPIGRALVIMDAGLAMALAPSVLHRLLGVTLTASLGFAWYFLATMTLITASTLQRTWIMSRAQWQARHRDGGTRLTAFLSPWLDAARKLRRGGHLNREQRGCSDDRLPRN